jgi:uracil-DNA glycosylase
MDPNASPLSALSLIVAPAILTNASTVLTMSTSNRLARASDRARELAKQLEAATDHGAADTTRRMKELATTERRSLLLLSALRSIYVALGSFASATVFALLSVVLWSTGYTKLTQVCEVLGLAAGIVALCALVHGSLLLVRETRITVELLQERVAGVRARLRPPG